MAAVAALLALLVAASLIVGRRTQPTESIHEGFREQIVFSMGELFRAISYAEIGASSFQSRCIAGVANATYIFCLPGSSGACATGWDKLIAPQLDYRTRPCNLAELMPRLKE